MKHIIFYVCLLVISLSCGKSKSGKKEPTLNLETISGLEALETDKTLAYSSECLTMGSKNNKFGAIHRFEYKYDGKIMDFSINTRMYPEGCATPAMNLVHFKGNGQFQDNTHKMLSANLTSASMTLYWTELATAFSKDSACGRAYWQTYVSYPILGTSCASSPENDVYFDTNAEGITLYFCNRGQVLSKDCDRIPLKAVTLL